jgi:hypothetical protein
MIRYFEYFAGKIPANTNSTKPRWSDFYMDSSGQGKMTTVSKPVFITKDGRRVFEGVVGIDVLASDFGENLDDNAMSDALNSRSKQCINFDFTLADLSESLSSTEENGVKCEIMEREPSGTMVPTGATLDEIDDNHCDGSLPWWGILLIVLGVLGCCGGIIFWSKRIAYKKKQRTINNKQRVVQMGHQPQYTAQAHGQPHYNVQARPMNVQVVHAQGMHPGQPMMMQGGAMQMQQQRGSITMGMQQPGQYPMQPVQGMQMQQPMGMQMQQPMGMQMQQPMGIVHAQPMGMIQGIPMQQQPGVVQPIAVQQNTAANQQSQQFGQPNP